MGLLNRAEKLLVLLRSRLLRIRLRAHNTLNGKLRREVFWPLVSAFRLLAASDGFMRRGCYVRPIGACFLGLRPLAWCSNPSDAYVNLFITASDPLEKRVQSTL